MIAGDSWGHLWYLYELVGIYLVLPIIKLFIDNASSRDFIMALAVLFIFNLCVSTINSINPAVGFYLPIKGNSLFYLLLGRYLDKELEGTPKNYRVYLLICSAAALILLPIIFYEKRRQA